MDDARVEVKEFIDLVDATTEVDEKIRLLWIEVYRNAVADRQYAQHVYEDLSVKISSAVENHGLYGDKLAKYMERMSRANDQLLLLSKQISEHVVSDGGIDSESIYKKING